MRNARVDALKGLRPAVTPVPELGPPPPPVDDDVLVVPELPDDAALVAVVAGATDDTPVFCAAVATVVEDVDDAAVVVLVVPVWPMVLASVAVAFGVVLVPDVLCVVEFVEPVDDTLDVVVVAEVVEDVAAEADVAEGAGLLELALELPVAGEAVAELPLVVEPLLVLVVVVPVASPDALEPLLVVDVVPIEDEIPPATELADVPALANDVAAVPPSDAPVPGLSNPVPPCGPVMIAPPVEPAAAAASGRLATCCGVVISPRTSIVVSRSGPYAMPPGARMLLSLIAVTTSPRVKFEAAIFCGSTSTSIAGVTVPPALTFAMPSTCSRSGTISFVTSAERSAESSVDEVTTSVATVASLGSNVPTVGGERSLGKTDAVDCRRRWTSTWSVV
jgi:hypothetical protein